MNNIIEKLGVKKNLEIFSSTNADGRIKVNYKDLLLRDSNYCKMLEAMIRNAINAEANKCNLPSALWKTWIDYNIPVIEKATGKSWSEIKELLV